LGLIRICSIFYGLLIIGHTGSRGAFLAAFAMFLVLLVCVSFFRKFLLLGFVAIVAVMVLATSSSSILDRYKELLTPEEELPIIASEAFEGAHSSREARQRHLKESLVLTLKNPLFGVGPGMFQVASSDEKFTGGIRGSWRQTHNTLTEFSSECGVPAAVLFLGILCYCLKTPISLYRLARQHIGLTMLAEMSFCLLLSVLGLFVTSMFASIAYQFYYPVLLGLAVSLRRTADVEIQKVLQPTVVHTPPHRSANLHVNRALGPLRDSVPARLSPRRG
jgi:O-antigen ligase